MVTQCVKFVSVKTTIMQIEKATINDCPCVWKVFWKFCIPATYNFAVIYPWNLLYKIYKMVSFLVPLFNFKLPKQNAYFIIFSLFILYWFDK